MYPFRLLYGKSFGMFRKRIARLRRLASATLKASDNPPLPVRLQIETTDICNLKCRMCTREVLDGMNTAVMPLQKFRATVEEIAPYYVTLNGLGEPLLDQTIFEKLEFLHTRGIMTAMPTNGTYIRGERLTRLAANLPDTTTFSLDGARKESFEFVRILGDFDQITGNYRALLDLRRTGQARPGTRIQILCALQKGNLHDYRQMYALRRSLEGVDSFGLVPVFDYDREGRTFAALVPTREDVLALHSEIDRDVADMSNGEEKDFYLAWKSVSSVWLDSAPQAESQACRGACAVPWYSTYIDAKGRVYPCCYLTNSPHVMGNINETSFQEVWSGERYRSFRNALVNDREHLAGCATCSRNDSEMLHQLGRIRILL